MTKSEEAMDRYHHGDLKRALIEAGIELIHDEGADALSVAELARRLGVSSGAPYKHFRDRQALLRAIAQEGNRQLNEAMIQAVGDCSDPVEAFRRTGVTFICWAADHPELFRVTSDPRNLDYTSKPDDVQAPRALEGTVETFWTDLAALVRSGAALQADHPLLQQLRGRALAQGMASFFVSGTFAALGIETSEAERLAQAITGTDVPAVRRK